MLADGHFEWLLQDQGDPGDVIEIQRRFGYLMPDIETVFTEVNSCFRRLEPILYGHDLF